MCVQPIKRVKPLGIPVNGVQRGRYLLSESWGVRVRSWHSLIYGKLSETIIVVNWWFTWLMRTEGHPGHGFLLADYNKTERPEWDTQIFHRLGSRMIVILFSVMIEDGHCMVIAREDEPNTNIPHFGLFCPNFPFFYSYMEIGF